jgi:hypothetical protein
VVRADSLAVSASPHIGGVQAAPVPAALAYITTMMPASLLLLGGDRAEIATVLPGEHLGRRAEDSVPALRQVQDRLKGLRCA